MIARLNPTIEILYYDILMYISYIVVESLGGRLPDTIFPQNISSLHRGIFSPK